MLVGTLLNLGVNAAVATVIYHSQQTGVGPATIGLVTTTIGVGMLLGSLVAPALLDRFPTGRLVVGGLLLAVAAFAVLPLVHGVPATLAVMGIGILWARVRHERRAPASWFMSAVPTPLLGRAGSAVDLLGMAALPLSPVVAGFGLSLLGPRRDALDLRRRLPGGRGDAARQRRPAPAPRPVRVVAGRLRSPEVPEVA